MTRIYLAGPMTGYPDLNFPAFHAEAARLRELGHVVINPAEINPATDAAWLDCMRADVPQLLTCERIHLLPGWELSRGASLEHTIASALEFEVTTAAGATHPAGLHDPRARPGDGARFVLLCNALLAEMSGAALSPREQRIKLALCDDTPPSSLDLLRARIDAGMAAAHLEQGAAA